MELQVVWGVKKELSSQKFVQKAPCTPHITEPVGAHLFPAIVFVSIFPCVYDKLEHLRRFAEICPSVALAQFVLLTVENFALSEIANCQFNVPFGLRSKLVGEGRLRVATVKV